VEVLGFGIEVQQPRHHLARRLPLLEIVHGVDAVVDVVVGGHFAQAQHRAVMLRHFLDGAGLVDDGDGCPCRDEVEAVHGLVVLAHVIEALGRAEVVVEGDARADDVDEGGAVMGDGGLQERHELRLVAGEAARDEARAQLQRHGDHVDGGIGVGDAALALRALVGRRRELAFCQAVDAVVLDQIDHVDAAADAVRELAEPDRRAVAVAGDAEIKEIAVGEVGAGQHRGHAAMDAVEAMRRAEEIGRRLRRAADARELGDAMRRQIELVAGLDDGGAD
jgi:hypothetical protein